MKRISRSTFATIFNNEQYWEYYINKSYHGKWKLKTKINNKIYITNTTNFDGIVRFRKGDKCFVSPQKLHIYSPTGFIRLFYLNTQPKGENQ